MRPSACLKSQLGGSAIRPGESELTLGTSRRRDILQDQLLSLYRSRGDQQLTLGLIRTSYKIARWIKGMRKCVPSPEA